MDLHLADGKPGFLAPIIKPENSTLAHFTDEASVQFAFLIFILGLLHIGRHHFRGKASKQIHISENPKISEKTKAEIPGPPGLPIIGVTHYLVGSDPFQLITNICNRYGKILKGKILLQDFVLLNDPVYIQKMLSSTSPSHLNKPSAIYHAVVGGIVPNGLIASEYPTWKNHRKVITRPLAVHQQIKKINIHIERMIVDLRRHANANNGLIDEGPLVFNLMNDTSLDLTLNIIMNMDVVSEEEKHEFHKNVLFNKRVSGQRITKPWLLINFIWRFHPLRKQLVKTTAKVRKFVDHVYGVMCEDKNSKIEESTNDENGARVFKCIMGEMADAKFSNDDVFQEVLTMIAAGYETTTWTLSFLLMRLALNPDIQEKCRKEVDELFEKKLEETNKEETSIHDVNSLEYLDRCLKETLRITPTVPIFARRLDQPLKLDDNITLQEGTCVAMCPWATHRNCQVFPDPEKFDPDRFLPEEIAKRHAYTYFPFSGGMRNCPGSKIGPVIVKLAAARILRDFVVETKDTWESLKFVFEVSLAAEKEIHFCLRKRTNIK